VKVPAVLGTGQVPARVPHGCACSGGGQTVALSTPGSGLADCAPPASASGAGMCQARWCPVRSRAATEGPLGVRSGMLAVELDLGAC
jgi:hypothetical protein